MAHAYTDALGVCDNAAEGRGSNEGSNAGSDILVDSHEVLQSHYGCM